MEESTNESAHYQHRPAIDEKILIRAVLEVRAGCGG